MPISSHGKKPTSVTTTGVFTAVAASKNIPACSRPREWLVGRRTGKEGQGRVTHASPLVRNESWSQMSHLGRSWEKCGNQGSTAPGRWTFAPSETGRLPLSNRNFCWTVQQNPVQDRACPVPSLESPYGRNSRPVEALPRSSRPDIAATYRHSLADAESHDERQPRHLDTTKLVNSHPRR